MKPQWSTFSRTAAVTAGFFVISQGLFGAGFALQEHSFSGIGTGFASGAAGGEDNSAMFFNAASLALFDEPQVTTGIHWIRPEAEFKNEGTVSAYSPGVSPGVPTQGPDATSDRSAVVPNLFASLPVTDAMVLGVGLSAPYGLATSYEDGWVGRYIALETDLATVNSNIAVGYKVSDTLSVGIGINIVHADAVLSNAVNFGAGYLRALNSGAIPSNGQTLALAQDVQANLGGTKYDGHLELTGDDFGFGFNLGALFTPNESTRIGVHYRSEVGLTLEGNADFTVGALDTFFGQLYADQGGKVDLDLPDTVQASIHHQVNPEWAVMADIFYTWWSKFDELVIEYETASPSNTIIPEKWDDTWRYSVGTTYQINEQMQLRGGLVFDESGVTSDTYRSPRIPDEDRVWLSIGLGYQVSDALKIDLGYVHIFVDDPVMDNPTHTPGEYLKGTMEATVDIISIGGTFRF